MRCANCLHDLLQWHDEGPCVASVGCNCMMFETRIKSPSMEQVLNAYEVMLNYHRGTPLGTKIQNATHILRFLLEERSQGMGAPPERYARPVQALPTATH